MAERPTEQNLGSGAGPRGLLDLAGEPSPSGGNGSAPVIPPLGGDTERRRSSHNRDVTGRKGSVVQVENGLEVIIGDDSMPPRSFTYGLPPGILCIIPLTKILIVLDAKVEHDHVSVQRQGLLDNSNKHTKALVVINNDNSVVLEQDIAKEITLPILVVKQSDGKELVEILKTGERKCLCNIKAKSTVDTSGSQPKVDTPQPQARANSKEGQFTNLLKSFLFKNDIPVMISDDRTLFPMVMSALYEYERGKREPEDLKVVVQKINSHIKSTFPKDFPFYIILAYKFHLKMGLRYHHAECQRFIMMCISLVETGPSDVIAETLKIFLSGEELSVTFELRDTTESVFSLFEKACIHMCKVSLSKLPDRLSEYIYKRMLWVSLALKVKSKICNHTPKETFELWIDYFPSYRLQLVMNKNLVDSIKSGIEFWETIGLPKEFSGGLIYHIILSYHNKELCFFQYLRYFFIKLHKHLRDKEFQLIMIHLRSVYKFGLEDSQAQGYKLCSERGSLAATLEEGLGFLNAIKDMWSEHDAKYSGQIKEELWKWLQLLLELIDVTLGQAVKQLEIIIRGKGVAKEYSKNINKKVVASVREKFSQLTIKKFAPLYEAFDIWPTELVIDYLNQYKLEKGMRIIDRDWIQLLKMVSKRYSGGNSQYFVTNFFLSVGVSYQEDGRAYMFIPDLLSLHVPGLLAKGVSENEDLDNFRSFLLRSIEKHHLQNYLLHHIIGIMDTLNNEKDDFQDLVLAAVKEEVVPDFTQKWRCAPADAALAIIEKSVKELCQNFNWNITVISSKQGFCWSVVARFCMKVPLDEHNLQWLNDNVHIINLLCRIFGVSAHRREDMHLFEPSTEECGDLRGYLGWINKVETLMVTLHQKMIEKELNYDEIMLCLTIQPQLISISKKLGISADLQILQEQKIQFCEIYEQLNIKMLKHVPGKSERNWCTLTSLLVTNGVSFPEQLSDVLTKYVRIPGESNKTIGVLLENEPPVSTTGKFTLGSNVSLKLSKELQLRGLQKLVDDLHKFLQPLVEHMEMLVFFSLNESVLFLKYHKMHLEEISIEYREKDEDVQSIFSLPGLQSINQVKSKDDEEMNMLVKSLALTEDILVILNAGVATYKEITAEGKIDLTSVNIDAELKILGEYIISYKPELRNEAGLSGVKNMLELFQYTEKVLTIHKVCEQYKLKGCLGDDSLKQLKQIAEDLAPRESREKLTPIVATDKLKEVKCLLFKTQNGDSRCLKLFDAVADCKAFHEFLWDRQLVGPQGREVFTQQCRLITAQLQHEDYDEQVLNHLIGAYQLMFPFIDTDQNFSSLMNQVVKLHTSNGLKQLYTVNSNIFLIQLWFSKAEGDTLHNVANQLEGIITTGSYIIRPSGGIFSITLQYVPKTELASHHLEGLHNSDSIQHSLSHIGPEGTSQKTKWTCEQINDFVLKLGFMDIKGNCGDQIRHFLHLNEVANKLLDLHIRLRDLGHPKYLTLSEKPILECNNISEAADKEFFDAQATLRSWTTTVIKLRSEHKLLLFVTVPKLLKINQLIQQYMLEHIGEEHKGGEESGGNIAEESGKECDENRGVENEVEGVEEDKEDDEPMEKNSNGVECVRVKCVNLLVKEIMFLICNDRCSRERLRNNIQRYLSQWPAISHNAMERVGGFLKNVLKSEMLPRRSITVDDDNFTAKQQGMCGTVQLLHHAPNYRQSQLVRLIVSIYNGVPESFEVFHCRSSSTKEQLCLFLDRINKHPLKYLVLEVNMLPFRLQEHLMQWCIKTHHLGQTEHQQVSSLAVMGKITVVHFVETASSPLRELPWIIFKQYEDDGPAMLIDGAQMKYKQFVNDFALIKLVYGKAGDGKTHYIKKQLQRSSCSVTISVNEDFTPVGAIQKLRRLPPTQENCAVFFNFTMIPPGESVDEREGKHYKDLIKVISWFFFDLLLLGYVEDPITGLSVCISGGMNWIIYVEVPSQIGSGTPKESLANLIEEIPALGIVGEPCPIDQKTKYTIDADVQLVCKYLNAYQTYKKNGRGGINQLYNGGDIVKFSTQPDLSHQKCYELLTKSWSKFSEVSKVRQKLFIKYMKRRCAFLDVIPAFNFNTGAGEYYDDPETKQKEVSNTRQLGSTLMETMLKEAEDFCSLVKHNWLNEPHQQLIYEIKDGGGSFGLLSLNPDELPSDDVVKFTKIGVNIPSMIELHQRTNLEDYLSRALNFEVKEIIDQCNYVLTLDYTIKMLNIHERHMCGVPVIIEGETGVGKTALVEMLSNLWTHSLLHELNMRKDRILTFMRKKLQQLAADNSVDMKSIACVEDISAGLPVNEEDLVNVCCLPDATSSTGYLYTTLQSELSSMKQDKSLLLLTAKTKGQKPLSEYFTLYSDKSAQATACLLHAVLTSEVKSTFHKINVHAALTPQQVFLDEINTSSCLGLFKELIVDHTFDGEPIPENMFIVAACNPHRGNSLGVHTESSNKTFSMDDWTRSTYYVRQLHPTLELLKWDYGSLDERQERHYIDAKMRMLSKEIAVDYIEDLTTLISESQKLMRTYVSKHLCKFHKKKSSEASVEAWSCVSQRDIQRVFVIFQWLQKFYKASMHHEQDCDYSRRAILVSLGVVYYMRLSNEYRNEYKTEMDAKSPIGPNFSAAFQEEVKLFMDNIKLPTGIARTQALMENVFATIVCTCTHTPLIIVGAPGSSKTLSFNLVIDNLKGQQSTVDMFRNTEIFHSLDPHFYQCSRQTTSNEIETVFSRAINRQQSHSRFFLPIYCVVFMDEAGLPEESHESLKVLHYHLDRQEVSFVAITNHMLDAAKSNRAICLFRPEATKEDLKTLAKECLSSKTDSAQPQSDLKLVENFSCAFYELMQKKGRAFCHFFGLRDFIHFINYLRRRHGRMLKEQVVMEAIERNFNGFEQFDEIAKEFLRAMKFKFNSVHKRSTLTVLKDSLKDHPEDRKHISESEVRYKLIIDASEDGSIIPLLFSLGVLNRQTTKVYMCSDFPGEFQTQKINTIAAIRHSAIEGHTVIMSQTDSIHESFYDLFNQRFRRIDNPREGPRYYTNIAIGAHSRPCRIHPNFQCVVVVKQSEVKQTPAPFLNRFEKYCITHATLLDNALSPLPPCLRRMLLAAKEKVESFVQHIGKPGFYGLRQSDTVDSLVLCILPPVEFVFQCNRIEMPPDCKEDVEVYLMKLSLKYLRENFGLQIPCISADELKTETEAVFTIVKCDSEFFKDIKEMSLQKDLIRAEKAVYEAISFLQRTTEQEIHSDKHFHISTEGCIVIQALQQWLVHYLVERLMQLMTAEAFIDSRFKLPLSYLKTYLDDQAHFSLRDLITLYLGSKWDTTPRTSKLLCFTRSSSLIYQLPAQYPNKLYEKQNCNDIKQNLKRLIHDEVEELMICKLSSIPSQQHMLGLLHTFTNSHLAKVLVLVINVQEVKKEVVNHIRTMIDEEEVESVENSGRPKLFVLLLHYPPSSFGRECYPSLFLKGWDHYYLDTIGQEMMGSLDIRKWLQDCYFPQDASSPSSILTTLNDTLEEAIPILISRVHFGFVQEAVFNNKMNVSKRTKLLTKLFFQMGLGNTLCEVFSSYWKPRVMSKYLKDAAIVAKTQDSTLNITDSIHTTFKNLFFDFLVYMVTRINVDGNIDVLFQKGFSETQELFPRLQELFLKIVKLLPIPQLSDLKRHSFHFQVGTKDSYLPHFPFFKQVSKEMKKVVEDSQVKVNTNLFGDLETDSASSCTADQQVYFDELQKVVLQEIQELISEKENSSFLGPSLKALKEIPELWKYYFKDFTVQNLHLETSDGISEKMLDIIFLQYHKGMTVLKKFVHLHVFVTLYHPELARTTTILRSLDQIQRISMSVHYIHAPSPTDTFMDAVQKRHGQGTPQDLSKFVIDHFFNILAAACMPSSSQEQVDEDNMLLWYEGYRDLMCLPDLKKCLYSVFDQSSQSTMVVVESRFNVMHTVFLMIQSGFSHPEQSRSSLICPQKVFHGLFNDYFMSSMELKAGCPRLGNVAIVAKNLSPQSEVEHTKIQLLMEGLFSHFFSAYRPNYHVEDVQWFLELANHQYNWCTQFGEKTPMNGAQKNIFEWVLQGSITLSVFKMYLSQILGKCNKNDPLNPLALHENFPRNEVGKVIMRMPDLGEPTHYIPTFYHVCRLNQLPSSSRMQQPLAHLYFLTVFEHLLNREQSFPSLVFVSKKLSNDSCSRVAESTKVVLQIELQAALQVITKRIAVIVQFSEIFTLTESINDVNQLFSKGNLLGHGMVVALHLLKSLKSSRKFVELMTSKYDARYKAITCLESIHDRLKEKSAGPNFHQLPFMLPNKESELSKLYQSTKRAILRIHDGEPNAKKELEIIAKECNDCSFKMMMWLTIYYEFFDKKRVSPTLCNIIGEDSFCKLANLSVHEVRLFKSFLDTSNIISVPEDPDPLRHDEEVLELLPNGRHRRKSRAAKSNMVDPLYELFLPPPSSPIDQSDEDLRYALANMVAVVLGCRPQSNHLWFHLFNQQPLWNTYLTGFMYRSKIKDGLLYDCGVVLTPEGEFGRPDYLPHANRGAYTLHSLYLILFVNFGSFCIAMLTQPSAQKNIHGSIISDWLSVRHYCVSQLRSLWLHIRNNLGVSEEERSFLIMKCMKRFYEAFSNNRSSELPGGVLSTIEQLDTYEKFWHLHIYTPSREELIEQFTQMQHTVFTDIRNLELEYPCYPTEKDLTHSLLTFQDTGTEDITLISQFTQQWQRLQAGGKLLPDLLEFYQWLHSELAHVISYQRACEVTIGYIIERVTRKYSTDMKNHWKQLFSRVKEGYNEYVDLIGKSIGIGACAAVQRGNAIYTIEDHTPLLHFLSDGEEEAGNDWLFIVIADIITAHNTMLDLPRQLASQPFIRLLPNKQTEAFPNEITATHSIVPQSENPHGITELLQLIRSRQKGVFHPQTSSTSVLQDVTMPNSFSSTVPLFHLDMLQEDIITRFIAGKPFICDLSTLRTQFQFKMSASKHQLYKRSVISSDELADMKMSLGELTKNMDEGLFKRLELVFHAAGYHTILYTTTGLKTAAGYLVKTDDVGGAFNNTWTFREFLQSLYAGHHSVTEALSEIGMRQLTETQVTCLLDIPLANLYHCLEVFSNWMGKCVYDFSTLPYTLKSHLEPSDLSTLKALPLTWKEPMTELLNEVNALNEQLSRAEVSITNQNTSQSIMAYLKELNVICNDDLLPNYIPNTILIRHYVQLRIVLREILREVQQKIDQEVDKNGTSERDSQQWDDRVEDIWAKHLPNFRGFQYTEDGPFLYDAAKGRYQYEIESEEDDLIDSGEMGDIEEEEGGVGGANGNEMRSRIELKEGETCESVVVGGGEGETESVNGSQKENDKGEQMAAKATPEQVAEFITTIGFGQYAKFFLDDEMDGEMMLDAKDSDLPDQVDSRLHRVKIIALFRSTFAGTKKTSLSVDDVGCFLKAEKLDKFIDIFKDNAIDGDILEAILERDDAVDGTGGMTVADLILKDDLGIQKGPQRLKIKSKFKRFHESLAELPNTT